MWLRRIKTLEKRLSLTSYHYSVVKVLLIERAGFYHPAYRLSRLERTNFADVFLSCNIGSPDW